MDNTNNLLYQFRIIVLWLLLLIGMILHFNYHVSEIFYGINVVRPGATGKIPVMAHVIKSIFYHLPILFIVALLFFKSWWFRLTMLVVSCLYTVSHVFHLIGEFKKEEYDWAQIPLLSIVLFISILLNKISWQYVRYGR